MKNTRICPKCGSRDVVRIPDHPGRYASGSNIYTTRFTLLGKIPVIRYVCCAADMWRTGWSPPWNWCRSTRRSQIHEPPREASFRPLPRSHVIQILRGPGAALPGRCALAEKTLEISAAKGTIYPYGKGRAGARPGRDHMDHFEKIAAQLDARGLDAMLLTNEANRFYASGFRTAGTDGMALVTRDGCCYYMTDSRYTEAAERHVRGAAIQEVGAGRGYAALLKEAAGRHHIRRLGFEDAYMTVREHGALANALPCELVPAADLLSELRAVKDPEELDVMVAAQRIAERALTEVLNEIRPGVTEKEIAARLQYLMLHYGAEDMSFDPIVVSGPTGAFPTGSPRRRRSGAGSSSPWTSAACTGATART